MNPQALNTDSHINPQIASTNSSNAITETANRRRRRFDDHQLEAAPCLEEIDSYFSRSEMAAAEQLVQLSDASCNSSTGGCDGDDRSEISSSCSAVRMKIEEIFGSFDGHCEDNRKRRRKRTKKYGSLADIYKKTTPLINWQSIVS